MTVTMRNKSTGEFREMDAEEFKAAKSEVNSAGFPAWEQTSDAHADDVKGRAAYGALLENEFGEDLQKVLQHEALVLDAEGVGPEVNPHLQLSPGEVASGLTPEEKLDQLHNQYAPSVPKRHEVEHAAHAAIAPGGEVTPKAKAGGPSKGLRARAGGTEADTDSGSTPKSQAEQIAAGAAAGSEGGEE